MGWISPESKENVKHLFETTSMTYDEIAKATGTTYKQVWRVVHKNYPEDVIKQHKSVNYRESKLGGKNPMAGKVREKNHMYKGVIDDDKGYKIILKPEWYTGRPGSRHVFYHHVVICEDLGLTELPKGYDVHHCDLDPWNNDVNNLLLISRADHMSLHHFMRSEGVTTISKESTAKWLEARRQGADYAILKDIVYSGQECSAADNAANVE